ncbi:MAG: hypothetical protein L0Y77_03320 [Chlorobi bacterium]|nr:hypothetical protein [Chlorobiota bacterium]
MKLSKGGMIGLIIGGLGGLVGLASAAIFGGIPGLIMALVFALVFGGVFWSFLIKPMMITSRLNKVGVSATAKIIELHDTGVTLNNDPQVKLLLEVYPPMGQTYMVQTKQYISRLQIPSFQPGNILPVKIDPNNKDLIAFDYGDDKAPASGNSNFKTNKVLVGPWAGISSDEAQKKLYDIDNKNKEILTYGVSLRAIVTKYTWLGIYVNGQNPAVELEIEVLPQDRPSFRAAVYGVIKDTSVQKYQAGEEIFVKYDPTITSKVAIEHS